MTYAMNAHTGEIIDTALASLITQAVETLRATFKRFVAASPQTCPPYHSIVVPFQKAEMEITLRPDRAVTNRYRVTVQSLKPNYYGVRPTEKTIDILLVGGTPLHLPKIPTLSHEEIAA